MVYIIYNNADGIYEIHELFIVFVFFRRACFCIEISEEEKYDDNKRARINSDGESCDGFSLEHVNGLADGVENNCHRSGNSRESELRFMWDYSS
eukprot:UN03241